MKKSILKFLMLFALATSFTSCDGFFGEEIARLKINQTSNNKLDNEKKAIVELKKGETISFWTDTDIEYNNELELTYTLSILKDDEFQETIELNALDINPTMNEVKSSIGKSTTWSYMGKMSSMEIKEDGEYTFIGFLNSNHNSSLVINKCELVIKK